MFGGCGIFQSEEHDFLYLQLSPKVNTHRNDLARSINIISINILELSIVHK